MINIMINDDNNSISNKKNKKKQVIRVKKTRGAAAPRTRITC